MDDGTQVWGRRTTPDARCSRYLTCCSDQWAFRGATRSADRATFGFDAGALVVEDVGVRTSFDMVVIGTDEAALAVATNVLREVLFMYPTQASNMRWMLT